MSKHALPTRALLACGAVAGPTYVIVTLVQALTRDGFDLGQHRFSWLTGGELGWIQQANMLLVGTATVLLAIGVSRVRTGRGSVWGPRLLGLLGLAYVVGGSLTADPVAGFPPGTTAEMVQRTWQAALQNATRGVSSLLLVAASLTFSAGFAAEGRRGSAWFHGTAIPVAFAALTAVGVAVGGNPVAFAFLATPWLWVTALALHLYRRETLPSDVQADEGTPGTLIAG